MVALAAALWAIAVVGAQLECVDAARAGARAAARGESIDAVRAAIARSGPPGVWIKVSVGETLTRVEVSVTVRPRWGVVFPGVQVKASAAAATERGVAS